MTDIPLTTWLVEFATAGTSEPIKVRIDHRVTVGRFDKRQGVQPDIDLSPFDAEALGVSRQHLSVHVEHDQLMITDLSSGNGTWLNGVRLEPGKPTPARHDDRLRLGLLQVDLHVVVSPSYGSIMHKQPSLQLHDQVQPGDGQLLLIVEDDIEVARLLGIILERAGYTTVISQDVISAMRVFNQKHPAAILLDLMLPNMHGLELCRYVRRDAQHSATPIIIISAARTPDSVAQAMQAGADVFLAKPISARELRHVVSSMLQQHNNGHPTLQTKHLVGTAPLTAMTPESRRDAAVLFVSGHNDAPITVTLRQPVSLGRTPSTPTSRHHIDLTRYDAIDQGVSRVHAFLHHRDGQFFVEDAGSINGTFHNGEPLKPRQLVEVHNADEIRLGQLRMYIYFLVDDDVQPTDEPGDADA